MLLTSPARIEGIHRLAKYYAPHNWPDLPDPKGKIGLRPYQYHQIERWMAREMPKVAAAENKAAWLHNRYTSGETSRDAVNRMNPRKPKGRRDLRDSGRIEGQWVVENGRPVRHYSVTKRQEAAE